MVYSAAADTMELIFHPIKALRSGTPSDRQQYRDLEFPQKLNDPYVNREQVPPSNADENTQKPAKTRRKARAKDKNGDQDPFIIPSDKDLRHTFVDDQQDKLATYKTLKATGNVANVADILPE